MPDSNPRLAKAILQLMGALFMFVRLDATTRHLGQTYAVPMLACDTRL